MLIISKKSHKDYYDGVAGSMGIDKAIVYERHIDIIKREDNRFPEELKAKSWDEINPFHDICFLSFDFDENQIKFEPFIVFFCGKTHIGWKKHTKESPYDFSTEYIYDENYIKKHNKYKGWRMNIDEIFTRINNYDPIELHRQFNSSILLLDIDHNRVSFKTHGSHHNSVFIVNPILKDYEFYKIFDSFLAFQEIQMYISGVLGNSEKDTIEIDDKHKITQHGFDNKWSFRKEPTKKK